MRITLRLVSSLAVAVVAVAVVSAYLQVKQEKGDFQQDLERRARAIALALEGQVKPLIKPGPPDALEAVVEKFDGGEEIVGVAIYDPQGKALVMTPRLRPVLASPPRAIAQSLSRLTGAGEFLRLGGERLHVYALPLAGKAGPVGTLAVFQDASFIRAQLSRTWFRTLERVLVQM